MTDQGYFDGSDGSIHPEKLNKTELGEEFESINIYSIYKNIVTLYDLKPIKTPLKWFTNATTIKDFYSDFSGNSMIATVDGQTLLKKYTTDNLTTIIGDLKISGVNVTGANDVNSSVMIHNIEAVVKTQSIQSEPCPIAETLMMETQRWVFDIETESIATQCANSLGALIESMAKGEGLSSITELISKATELDDILQKTLEKTMSTLKEFVFPKISSVPLDVDLKERQNTGGKEKKENKEKKAEASNGRNTGDKEKTQKKEETEGYSAGKKQKASNKKPEVDPEKMTKNIKTEKKEKRIPRAEFIHKMQSKIFGEAKIVNKKINSNLVGRKEIDMEWVDNFENSINDKAAIDYFTAAYNSGREDVSQLGLALHRLGHDLKEFERNNPEASYYINVINVGIGQTIEFGIEKTKQIFFVDRITNGIMDLLPDSFVSWERAKGRELQKKFDEMINFELTGEQKHGLGAIASAANFIPNPVGKFGGKIVSTILKSKVIRKANNYNKKKKTKSYNKKNKEKKQEYGSTNSQRGKGAGGKFNNWNRIYSSKKRAKDAAMKHCKGCDFIHDRGQFPHFHAVKRQNGKTIKINGPHFYYGTSSKKLKNHLLKKTKLKNK